MRSVRSRRRANWCRARALRACGLIRLFQQGRAPARKHDEVTVFEESDRDGSADAGPAPRYNGDLRSCSRGQAIVR